MVNLHGFAIFFCLFENKIIQYIPSVAFYDANPHKYLINPAALISFFIRNTQSKTLPAFLMRTGRVYRKVGFTIAQGQSRR
jgi:hypothetical protein